MPKNTAASHREAQPVTLRTVAEYVGLAPCSVSAVLNNSAAGMSIPQQTKEASASPPIRRGNSSLRSATGAAHPSA